MPVRRTCSAWNLRDPRLASAGDVAQLVEFGMIALADQAPFLERQRRDHRRAPPRCAARTSGQSSSAASSSVSRSRRPRGQPGLDPRATRRGCGPARRGRGAWRGPCPPARPDVPGRTTCAKHLAEVVAEAGLARTARRRRRAARRWLGDRSRARSATRRAVGRPSAWPCGRSRRAASLHACHRGGCAVSSRLRRVISSSASVSARR